jgi:hypothetical protein
MKAQSSQFGGKLQGVSFCEKKKSKQKSNLGISSQIPPKEFA